MVSDNAPLGTPFDTLHCCTVALLHWSLQSCLTTRGTQTGGDVDGHQGSAAIFVLGRLRGLCQFRLNHLVAGVQGVRQARLRLKPLNRPGVELAARM